MKLADAINRLVDGVGMQGGQHQIPGFRRLHGGLDAVVVPDFPDEDDFRVLPHRAAYPAGE